MASLDRLELDVDDDVFLQDGLCPTIAEHALQCDSLFQSRMASPDITPDPTVMDDQLARFTLWASNMDVYGPPNVSLDYRLRYSPTIVEIIHQLLDVIYNTLMSLKPVDDLPQTPSRKRRRISIDNYSETLEKGRDDANDADSDEDQGEDNATKITYTIGGTVTRLFRLSNAVRRSATAKRARKIGRYTGNEDANNAIAELRAYTDCYIRFRFPLASESLRSSLVEANAIRLRRFYYQRAHRRRTGLRAQQPQRNTNTAQLPKVTDTAPAVHFAADVLWKPNTILKKSNDPPPIPLTNATTARQTAVGAIYAKSTTEVPRAKSILVNNKLSFPPLPPTNECPYCGVVIEFKSSAKSIMWQDHVIRDLEPFLCIIGECMDSNHGDSGPLSFETSKAWANHLQYAHGTTWECRAPSHDPMVFNQEDQYQEHSMKEHGVPETHVRILSGAARRPTLNKILECPFGDDFCPPERAEPNPIFSSEALLLHVASHMKEIALLALQKLSSDAEDNAESVDSGHPIEDDGSGLAKLRGSMYSVLDDEALDFQDMDRNNITEYHDKDISPSVEKLDLEDRDSDGMTKLHHALHARDLLLTQSLIDQGVNLRSRANDGKTPLHYASLESSQGLDLMKLLLNSGDQAIVDLVDENGQTPLHLAAEVDSIDAVKLLVQKGANLNATDKNGFDPILWAIIAGQARAFEELNRSAASINRASADGKDALGWATSLGHLKIAKLLLERGADPMFTMLETCVVPLEEAAANGNERLVTQLVESGADVTYRDRDGWSAMHWAAEEGDIRTINVLWESGADVNAVSSYGTSPLHCAAHSGNDNVRSLLQCGANHFDSTCHGWTPLHHAAFMGHSHHVQALLQAGSNASSQDNHGWSVLHLAVLSRDLATIRLLLDSTVATDFLALRDESGFTAREWLDDIPRSHLYAKIRNLALHKSHCCGLVSGLREAAAKGNIPMIDLLLKQGHPINGTNSGRRTALYHAVQKGFINIVEMLLARGADPNILPAGRRSWEEFVTDDIVISRLVQAGYRMPSSDPAIDHEIRLAFDAFDSGQSANARNGPASTSSPTPAPQRAETPTNTETRRSSVANLLKRLRKW